MKNLIILLLLLIGLGAKAQQLANQTNGKLHDIAVSLDSLRTRIPIEKVHIQFDKPFYSLGDTIWMKAYVVNELNGLSPLSKILYADLVDDRDSVAVSLHLPLTDGLAWGAITLTDSLLAAGNYHIRAYTTLMRNFGQDYFFDRVIRIGNALPATGSAGTISGQNIPTANKSTVKTLPDSAGISVQFFPEGGDLVNDLISKVAFKAIGTDGLSREIAGSLVDKYNNELFTFRSEHAGIGTFTFQPAEDNTYTAVIKFADGSEKHFKLPRAKPQGYGLTVSQRDDNIIVNIQASKALLNTGELSLIAQANSHILYTGKKEFTRTGYTAIIPKSRFPEGIVQFTLFSPQYQPVAERLIFVKHDDEHLKVNIVPDKTDYKKRDKVHLDLQVTDQEGKPVTGAFSLAITDEGKVPYAEADEKTIFSNLLLTSDLKGYIEQPNYYFIGSTPEKTKQLDNLMLTQGWRRFVWNDIVSGNLPALTYLPETGMGISGRILTGKGKPVPHAKVSILINTGNGAILDTVANAQGAFNFDNFPFAKGISYNVSAVDAKGKKGVTVEIDKKDFVLPSFTRPAEPAAAVDGLMAYNTSLVREVAGNSFATYIDSARRRFDVLNKNGQLKPAIKLKEVEIKARPTAREVAFKYSDSRSGAPDQELTFVDLANCTDLGACLMGKIADMRFVMKGPGGWKAFYQGSTTPVTVVVDGQIRTADYYNTLTPDVIAGIEVIKGSRAGNLYGGNITGAIIITTKRGGVDYESYITEHNENVQKGIIQKKDEKEKAIALKEVTIQGKKEDKVKEIALKYSQSLNGPADQVLTFVDMADCNSLGGCMVKHSQGLRVVPGMNGGFTAYYEGAPMVIVVDGKSVGTSINIAQTDIAGIEIIKGARGSIYPGFKGGGAIVITLKRGGVDYESYITEHNDDLQKTIDQKKEERKNAIALKEVTIQEKKIDQIKQVALKDSKNLAGPGWTDFLFTFADLAKAPTLALFLVTHTPGAHITLDREGTWNAGNLSVIVNGYERDKEYYNAIPAERIAAIEVLKHSKINNGARGNEGSIIITLKNDSVDYQKYIDKQDTLQNKAIALKEVTIKEKKITQNIKEIAVKNSQNLAGPGNANQVLTFIDLLPCQNSLRECLEGRIITRFGIDALWVVIDGVEGRELSTVVSSDVASIEVLLDARAALYGMHGDKGVLIVTTKKGDVDYTSMEMEHYRPGYTKPKGLITYKLQQGYDLRRQFYAPDYDNPATNKDQPDLRSTIYWKPNIITDENGKASVEFFNADGTGNYHIITEGLDGLGKLGRQDYRYTVK